MYVQEIFGWNSGVVMLPGESIEAWWSSSISRGPKSRDFLEYP